MTAWTPDQLAAAIGVLVAAFAANAVVLARAYSQVVNLVEGVNRSGVPIRGAKGQPGAGGGARLAASQVTPPPLLPSDRINQLTGVTVSPAAAPTGPADCGPACVVSCIEELKGCWSADELLRLRYFGAIDSRYTTADDLVGMLQANGIAAHARKSIDAAIARQEIVRNWQAGRPCLILGWWVSTNDLHWVKFLGDRSGPIVMNPWSTSNAPSSWAEFDQHFYGDYVHVDGAVAA